MKQLISMLILGTIVLFNFFKYKTKLLDTEADGSNRIFENAKIAVTLKYLSNLWKSLEVALINCNVESKLKWTNHCALSANGKDNDHANSNNIIFKSKTQNYHEKTTTLTKLLRRGFERSVYWN